MILRIAIDTPLRRVFDYLPPVGAGGARAGGEADPTAAQPLTPGVRVRVPFGRRSVIGILVATSTDSNIPAFKLKAALEILDSRPIFDKVTFDLLLWAADYYHHPTGEVMAAALPISLRDGEPAEISRTRWVATAAGLREIESPSDRRAPQQRALLARLAHQAQGAATTVEQIRQEFKPAVLKILERRGWIAAETIPATPAPAEPRASDVELTEAQARVVAGVSGALGRFSAHLLYGVTGSGKTEVYLRIIATALAHRGQVLVLVPEIALTPQLVERFRLRFSAGVVVLHSGLNDAVRRDAWRAAHSGEARIVIGTRSAVFISLKNLALIVIDEEHDASYKQHEGFRYSARDLAVWRAQRAQVPAILGSATPSLETLHNVAEARYTQWSLPQRAGVALTPSLVLVDLRRHASEQGLSQPAIAAIGRHLAAGGQVIVFLNRRGYAPTVFCNACGWVAQCAHCDARMTLHRRAGELRCHHCGAHAPVPAACGTCAAPLNPVGQGTERVEETLARLFPDVPLARLDRDSAQAHKELKAVLERMHRGEARILVGTQMLTKGHHFPEVSLVVILDADQGLFASDFRATERLAQTITQVAGRAGRAARPGEVMIQTSYPEHPLLTRLIKSGYEGFAGAALEERRAANWPPYSRLALLRAEARNSAGLDDYLRRAAARGRAIAGAAVSVHGPASALLARRADHFRAHLLIETAGRGPLQRFLGQWLPEVESLPGPPGLRWSIDVDPLEVD